ncbi:hypothetical protein [Pseudomonas sp. HS-18]|uniref:hypothetical protein n=1 Tax=Pseudomonas sp. HS-18 TaxID=2879114 RepID=UPI001CF054E9|nr:hypothetical protein [Pseudomonas sp. HS-18]UCL85718.1 hypothetical protein LDJ84_22615 [Pseudomonas sp. HS-18]
MKAPKDLIRIHFDDAGNFEESASGRFFLDPGNGSSVDLSAVRILGCHVDTVRQLYTGVLRPEVLALFEATELVDFAGRQWHPGRVGRDSGYQFKLQNADLGLVLLIKNYNVKAESPGPHLKIEVSPHLIEQHSPANLQVMLGDLASEILLAVEPRQCAVHLAVDFQGWTPPSSLVSRMRCKSRNVRQFDGIGDVVFDELAATYSRGQSFLFGSAAAMQCALYNKTRQAKAVDKLDYWENRWQDQDNPFDADPANYDPDQEVYRLEFRFHHSVVEQFAQGSCDASGAVLGSTTFAELATHLQGLFEYGLDNFRLLHRPGYVDPLWTLLHSDARFLAPVDRFFYRRYYKTARGFSGKNIELMLGNAITLFARNRMDFLSCWAALKSLPIFPLIEEYYREKGRSTTWLKKHLAKKLEERYVRYGMAA